MISQRWQSRCPKNFASDCLNCCLELLSSHKCGNLIAERVCRPIVCCYVVSIGYILSPCSACVNHMCKLRMSLVKQPHAFCRKPIQAFCTTPSHCLHIYTKCSVYACSHAVASMSPMQRVKNAGASQKAPRFQNQSGQQTLREKTSASENQRVMTRLGSTASRAAVNRRQGPAAKNTVSPAATGVQIPP